MIHQPQLKHLTLCIILFAFILGSAVAQENENNNTFKVNSNHRGEKVFSLFNVVTFKNSGCRSQSSLSSGQSSYRNGTCYTNTECASKGGTASGNCASGFGVCCLFLVSATGQTISENCTYIRNPGFPTAYSGTSSVSYTIKKCTSEICFLRLDFETFTIVGPTLTTEVSGGLCTDTFRITSNSGQAVPTICGMNTAQHIYVEMGNQATDSATLSFAFATTSTTRLWDIKVSQIECFNPARPPNGCLQYFTTLTGRITTFNFLSTNTGHLQNQDYSSCIKRQRGYCCVQYQVCTDVTLPWTLDGSSSAIAKQDSSCVTDYIGIPSTAQQCSSNNSPLFSKFCGVAINPLGGATTINVPVCTCVAPYYVHVKTDATNDGANTFVGRGTCLDYTQVPCTQN